MRLPAERVKQLVPLLSKMRSGVAKACHAQFPSQEGYTHGRSSGSGLVAADRFVVKRRGFVGVVSLQWYAKPQTYRDAQLPGVAVRITGRAKLHPSWSGPRLPRLRAHTSLRLFALGGLGLAALASTQFLRLVAHHPSMFPALDTLAVVAGLLGVGLAMRLIPRLVRGRWFTTPTPELREPSALEHANALQRWNALATEVNGSETFGVPDVEPGAVQGDRTGTQHTATANVACGPA